MIKSFFFRKKDSGFTLTEVLVGTVLISIVFLSLFGLYQLGLKVNIKSKARITATAIANQKMETIGNLSYSEVKYAPEGEIIQVESVFNERYSVATTIIPILDCFDGPTDLSVPECLDAPAVDLCEIDYKRIKIEVSWNFAEGGQVDLIGDVIPQSLSQECEEEKGILSVSVIDANSESVSFPLIEIIDPQTSTVVASEQPIGGSYDFTLFPQQSYKVKITAFGYEEQTYGEGDLYSSNGQEFTIEEPEKEHPWVEEDEIVSIAFQMDELGSINVQTKGGEEEIIGDISFTIWGSKLVGRDLEGDPIYKYLHSDMTDSVSGERLLSDLEFDSYYFSIDSITYDLLTVEPSQPVDLLPGEDKIVRLILGEGTGSLLITVLDSSTLEPLFGAETHLWNVGYNEKEPTDEYGQALFSSLQPETYNLQVKAQHYVNYQGEILISGEEETEIRLDPF